MPRIALYPGSFDPPTNGHLSIIQRGLKMFDGLIVAVLRNPAKDAVFNVDERAQLLREAVNGDARACGVIYGNIADLKYEDRSRVVREELPQALQRLREKFDLVFSDPPYALRASQAVLDGLSTNDLMNPGARVVLEMDRRDATPQCPEGFRISDERRYGDTRVVIVTH